MQHTPEHFNSIQSGSLPGVLGRRLPVVTCVALIGMGLFTLVSRAHLDPAALASRVSVAAAHGQHATTPTKAPCCEIDSHDR